MIDTVNNSTSLSEDWLSFCRAGTWAWSANIWHLHWNRLAPLHGTANNLIIRINSGRHDTWLANTSSIHSIGWLWTWHGQGLVQQLQSTQLHRLDFSGLNPAKGFISSFKQAGRLDLTQPIDSSFPWESLTLSLGSVGLVLGHGIAKIFISSFRHY